MLKRLPNNPIIRPVDITSDHPLLNDVSSVYNPGAVYFNGKHRLVLRVQARSRDTFLVAAESADGVHFTIARKPITFDESASNLDIQHRYDPRLTVIDGRCYMMFAADTPDHCTLGLAVTDDFETFELVGYGNGTHRDTRNGVRFPEKIDGQFVRIERPNIPQAPGDPPSGGAMTLSVSDDLVHWQHHTDIMEGRFRFWDERIGAGPPPIKTRHGWLCIYHGVATHFAACNIYQAGAILLDLSQPEKVIARTRLNILEPRELYELVGQVPNVVFPSGWIPSETGDDLTVPDHAELKIYYGAADTSVGLATTTVADLIHACKHPSGEPGEGLMEPLS